MHALILSSKPAYSYLVLPCLDSSHRLTERLMLANLEKNRLTERLVLANLEKNWLTARLMLANLKKNCEDPTTTRDILLLEFYGQFYGHVICQLGCAKKHLKT